jgi:hypothetical protein
MRGSEFIILAGPLHNVEELDTTPCDVEKPPLNPGQAAVTTDCYKEVLSNKGIWRWKAEWEILPNR